MAAILRGAGLATVVLAGITVVHARSSTPLILAIPAVVLALAVAVSLDRLVPTASLAPVGAVVGAVTLAVWNEASGGVLQWVLGAVLGAGVGLALPRLQRWRDPALLAGAGATAAALLVVGARVGSHPARVVGAAVVLAAGAAALVVGPHRLGRRQVALALVVAMSGTGMSLWIGANSASATWFGGVTAHGSRQSGEVAITFDDGPNPRATLAIRDILDSFGVKGTFFTVGRALNTHPDISRALMQDGHLLANHSYSHDYWRWLDPRYPELDRTQRVFARRLGVCPALYRPPHGQHTPFMTDVVRDRGMRAVTWDASSGDWAARDPQLVARRILAKARSGSVIVLHDGLDGHPADGTVVREALPIIIRGLQDRGLRIVRLDQLLGVPGYLPSCPASAGAAGPTAVPLRGS